MKKFLPMVWLILIIIATSCNEIFEYSPYVIDFDDDEQNLTQKNISKLLSTEARDTLVIALTGDSHRFYDQSERLVNTLNQQYNIDFLIHTGDFADYGIPQQYQWGNLIFSKLNKPYFVVIGNHDLVSNGEDSYREMFGNLNFSFIYDSIKFIFINTNSREYEFNGRVPDLNWLEKDITPNETFEKVILVFHTPPFDSDFDSEMEKDFMQILLDAGNVLFTTHGHLHSFNLSDPYSNGIQFINTSSVEKDEFVLVKIILNEITIDVIDF